MGQDYQSLYTRLGRLLEQVPAVNQAEDVSRPETLLWLGRVHAIMEQVASQDAISFRLNQSSTLHSTAYKNTFDRLLGLAYRSLALLESKVPSALAGSFVPVGNAFDAFAAISKLLQQAKHDVLFVDPYMDEATLVDFGAAVPDGVQIRLLADEATHKPSLAPAVKTWNAQHGAGRTASARLAAPKSLHDRAIFVDGTSAWTLTQSLKDFAKRSPAEIVRADDIATLKIPAYEAIWGAAKALG